MEKTSEQIRHDMAVAYFNTLRNREAELIKAVQAIREELTVCAKALDNTVEATGKTSEAELAKEE